MYDDDTYDVPPSEPDLLENSGYTIFNLAPLKFTDTPKYRNGSIPTNKTRYFDSLYIVQSFKLNVFHLHLSMVRVNKGLDKQNFERNVNMFLPISFNICVVCLKEPSH